MGRSVRVVTLMSLSLTIAVMGPAAYAASRREKDRRLAECQALASQGAKSLERQIACYTRFIMDFPKHSRAFFERGRTYHMAREDSLALADIDRAISLERKNAEYHAVRGLILMIRDSDRALESLNRALSLDRKLGFAYMFRGRIHEAQGDYVKALQDYDRSIELDPKLAIGSYAGRARVYESQGQYDRSLSEVYKALALQPAQADLLSLRGVIYWMKGEYQKAVSDYCRALETLSSNAVIYGNRGLSYWMLGEKDKALEDLKKSIQLDSKSANTYYHLAYLTHESGDSHNAHAYLQRAKELDPQILETRRTLLPRKTAPTTHAFYEKEMAVAEQYLTQGPTVPEPSPAPAIEVHSVRTIPDRPARGVPFDLDVSFTVGGSTPEEVALAFSYRISRDGRLLDQSSPRIIRCSIGEQKTWTERMAGFDNAGEYRIEIVLRSQQMTLERSIELRVE